MKPDVVNYLRDVLDKVSEIQTFTSQKTFDNYKSDNMLRMAVERDFEIIGEILNRINRIDPTLLAKIRDSRNIISFRNILAHGYDNVSATVVWSTIINDLSRLDEDVRLLLKQPQ